MRLYASKTCGGEYSDRNVENGSCTGEWDVDSGVWKCGDELLNTEDVLGITEILR